MARARNIKPGFFRNADLAELDFADRLLFIGLWTLADRSGRLEDRPKQIKMELFPADSVDCDAMLNQLVSIQAIDRYEVEGKRFIQVVTFEKHQNPHRDEKASVIPDRSGNTVATHAEPAKHSASTVQALCKEDANTVPIGLIPDSLIPDPLIPDSLIPDPLKEITAKTAPASPWLTVPDLVVDGLSEDVAKAWIAHRRTKKAKLTLLAWQGFKVEAAKAEWDIEAAVLKAITRNWIAFDSKWVAADAPGGKLTGAAAEEARRAEVARTSAAAKRLLFGSDDMEYLNEQN